MHRLTLDVSFAVLAAAVMASMVLLGGAGIEPATRPVLLSDRPREASADAPGSCLSSPLTTWPPSVSEGAATLCDVGRAFRVTVEAPTLAPGEAYAALLTYAPRPAACQDGPCPPTSLLGDSQAGLMDRLGEGVVPPSRTIELSRDGLDLRLLGHPHDAARVFRVEYGEQRPQGNVQRRREVIRQVHRAKPVEHRAEHAGG